MTVTFLDSDIGNAPRKKALIVEHAKTDTGGEQVKKRKAFSKRKAVSCFIMSWIVLALPVSQEVANKDELGTSGERQVVVETAEQYLSDWAYKSYMYLDKDLAMGTVLDPNVEAAKLALTVSEITASNDVGQSLYNEIVSDQVSSIHAAVLEMQANMQFMEDKATYFSEIRQYNGLQRTNFNIDYAVQNVDIQENVAIVDVLENISFQYVGVEDPSFSQEEHKVALLKVDGTWIVANVETKYDWFANEYKNTDYQVEVIIAEEKCNVQE